MDKGQMDCKQIYSASSSGRYGDEFCCSFGREGDVYINELSMTIHLLDTRQLVLACGSAESERQCGDTKLLQREDSLNGLYVRYYCFNYDNAICGRNPSLGGYKEPLKMEDSTTYLQASLVALISINESGNALRDTRIYAPISTCVACHTYTASSRLPLERSACLECLIPRLLACYLCRFWYLLFRS